MKESNCKGKNMLVFATMLASSLSETYSENELAEMAAFLSTLSSAISLIIVTAEEGQFIVTG